MCPELGKAPKHRKSSLIYGGSAKEVADVPRKIVKKSATTWDLPRSPTVHNTSKEDVVISPMLQQSRARSPPKCRVSRPSSPSPVPAYQMLFSEELASASDPEVVENRQTAEEFKQFGVTVLDVERVQTLFRKADEDGSGEIDKEEFRELLRKCLKVKGDLPESRFQRLWLSADVNMDGLLTFKEFFLWWQHYARDLVPPEIFNGNFRSVR
mmetsp:Transcript_12827/g.28830  ORF Transcript_12827/g.28830 Transcript_12827/m.28830 type:complete len:211 (+) Transcript_12827:1102-1734(+)